MKNLIIKLIILLPVYSFSQQTIKGVVKDSLNNPIVSANVIIKDSINNILAYAITNDKGFYQTSSFEYQENTYIQVSHISFEKESQKLSFKILKNQTLNFILKENKGVDLDEVVIVAKKRFFTTKKDTISYYVNSYSSDSDRKIQDVIRKLPGIELNVNTGEIKYNGKSIETVLLQGDNLFEHNYSLGTKNINVELVKQIQVIKNYSQNPLLKGIENGDKVALNLTLKKGKIDFSADTDSGIGFFEKRRQALDINSSILGIAKNYKSFAVLAYNNIGDNHSPFDYFGFSMNIEELKEKDFFAQKIIPETHFFNTLGRKRVNINNQYFGNYNAIFKINKRLKVKTNLYYLGDKIMSKQLFENSYKINSGAFTTTDNILTTKNPRQYRGDLKIEYNSSKTSSLKYNFRVRQENIKTSSAVLSNHSNNFISLLDSEDFYFKQKLSYTKRISDKKAFLFSLFQSINTIAQTSHINPSVINPDDYTANIQEVLFSKNYLGSEATLIGSGKNNDKYAFSIGGIFDGNILKSRLFGKDLTESVIIKNGTNDLKYLKKSMYQLGIYYLNIGRWRFSPSYSLIILSQTIRNNSSKKHQSDFIFEPSLEVGYELADDSFLSATVEYNKISDTEKYLFLNQILVNSRTTVSNTPSLELQKSINYNVSYFGNDLYNQLQINAGVNYQKNTGNFFTNYIINKNITHINYFYLPQDNSSLSFNFLIAKYVPFFKSTIKLNSNYSVSKYKNIVNNSELRNNKSQFLNIKLFMKTAFNSFINFENIINLSKSIFENKNHNGFINESLNDTFKIIFKPIKRWALLLSSDYFLPNRENASEYYLFLDARLRYRPKNKKFEFNFVTKNLLNETNFEQIKTSDFSTHVYRTNILPRYYLLGIKYNF